MISPSGFPSAEKLELSSSVGGLLVGLDESDELDDELEPALERIAPWRRVDFERPAGTRLLEASGRKTNAVAERRRGGSVRCRVAHGSPGRTSARRAPSARDVPAENAYDPAEPA